MSIKDFLSRFRSEQCPGAVPCLPLTLPEGVEGLAGTQTMQGGLPAATQAVWRALAAAFPKIAGLGSWGDRAHAARKSCHNSGKAIDAMTSKPEEHAAIVAWALANRSKFGITLVISRGRKWSAKTGWKPAPYKGTSPHNDHVHLSVQCDG